VGLAAEEEEKGLLSGRGVTTEAEDKERERQHEIR